MTVNEIRALAPLELEARFPGIVPPGWRVYGAHTFEHYADGDRTRLVAKYGLHYLPGNHAPYFFLSYDRWEKTGRGVREWEDTGGGSPGREFWEKHFPELLYLERWHLCDVTGTPMHYLANGDFWFEQIGVAQRYHENEPDMASRCFASTVVLGAAPSDAETYPLAVLRPFVRPCPTCRGKGGALHVAGVGMEYCPTCEGSGRWQTSSPTGWLVARQGELARAFLADMRRAGVLTDAPDCINTVTFDRR